MEGDVKAMLQQAQATQQTIQHLQAHEARQTEAGLGANLPLTEAAWGLVALLAAVALAKWWGRNRAEVSHFSESVQSPITTHLPMPMQPVEPAFAHSVAEATATAPEPEPEVADASDSDWGVVSRSAGLDVAVEFDLKVAASEVARVRQTLAQRRETRALQRAEDARRLQALAEQAAQAEHAAIQMPGVGIEQPLPEVLDVSRKFTIPSAPAPLAAVPFWQMPSQRQALVETMPGPTLHADESEEEEGETLPSLDNAYAIKLALARESAAVDLWTEARELIDEVLETDDPVLLVQARALLATIEQHEKASKEDD